jgi:hypothetical protein
VGFSDWLLSLHVISAFALMAGLVLFSAVVVASWAVDSPPRATAYFRLAAIGGPLLGAGAGLALLLGIVLAIDLDDYQVWDPWILASIVLWAVGGAAGDRVGRHYTAAQELAGGLGEQPSPELAAQMSDRRTLTLFLVTVVAFALVLLLMIFKPGA